MNTDKGLTHVHATEHALNTDADTSHQSSSTPEDSISTVLLPWNNLERMNSDDEAFTLMDRPDNTRHDLLETRPVALEEADILKQDAILRLQEQLKEHDTHHHELDHLLEHLDTGKMPLKQVDALREQLVDMPDITRCRGELVIPFGMSPSLDPLARLDDSLTLREDTLWEEAHEKEQHEEITTCDLHRGAGGVEDTIKTPLDTGGQERWDWRNLAILCLLCGVMILSILLLLDM